MTTAAAVRAAVAAKIAGLAHSRHVYSSVEAAGVAPWPQEFVDDGPHALVARGATSRTGGTGNQQVSRDVIVEWRFAGVDVAGAEATIDSLEDEILVAFSSGISLGGAVIECLYTGSERPVDLVEEEGGPPWVVWITHFATRERLALEMSP